MTKSISGLHSWEKESSAQRNLHIRADLCERLNFSTQNKYQFQRKILWPQEDYRGWQYPNRLYL